MPGKILELEVGQDFLAILYTLKNYTEGHNKDLWLGPWFNISVGRLSYILMNVLQCYKLANKGHRGTMRQFLK